MLGVEIGFGLLKISLPGFDAQYRIGKEQIFVVFLQTLFEFFLLKEGKSFKI